MLLVTQVQFLATLSLVDSTGADNSLLSGVARNLRSENDSIRSDVLLSFSPR